MSPRYTKRFVLEGEWSGYTSAQRRIVHREVIGPKRAEKIRTNGPHVITYTDGTSLFLDVREAKPREVIKPINGSGDLISKAERRGGTHISVMDLRS